MVFKLSGPLKPVLPFLKTNADGSQSVEWVPLDQLPTVTADGPGQWEHYRPANPIKFIPSGEWIGEFPVYRVEHGLGRHDAKGIDGGVDGVNGDGTVVG